ncbi:hypothetical protein [Alicyclobacillus pomorum]|uniref:hypothetical protein n=1 Tax=Alicyclobacillus pomorum TaxID=204470 RepID=UPI00042A3D86|nr:hypothetical protein [Alicyclobacillus pomorum]
MFPVRVQRPFEGGAFSDTTWYTCGGITDNHQGMGKEVESVDNLEYSGIIHTLHCIE